MIYGKDNKIKKVVEEELKGYEEFVKKALKLLRNSIDNNDLKW